MRIHITGASGSGATTLGRELAAHLGFAHLDGDDYYWLPTSPPFREKRDAGPPEGRSLAKHSAWLAARRCAVLRLEEDLSVAERIRLVLDAMKIPSKACPIVLRGTGALEVLAFEHPLAGLQLVKGGIEAGETPQQAAVRELREEAGLGGRAVLDLGVWESGHEDQVWSLQLCEVASPIPDRWVHRTMDDGGREFRFFWQPLDEEPGAQWHPVYRRALSHLKDMDTNGLLFSNCRQGSQS